MYRDRLEAGEELAEELAARNLGRIKILAIPRGGIVVAEPIARRLNARIDVLVTRKIGHPANPEVAIGAAMADGTAILDDDLIERTGVTPEYIKTAATEEYVEIKRRMRLYSGAETPPQVAGETAVIVDDGIATGYTLRAAIKWLKTLKPMKIIVAVPVAPPEIVAELSARVDEVICPLQPDIFMAVGMFYQHFPQNTDEEVLAIIRDINK